MEFVKDYLLIGAGVYIAMCVVNVKYFKGASIWSIAKGFFSGILGWPYALYITYLDVKKGLYK